jgi:hypothetical protein
MGTERERLLGTSSVTTFSARPSSTCIGPAAWTRPDDRRSLQLVLATIWLIDGVLQLQSFFFTRSFGAQMIAGSASGNPSVVARPITWSGATIAHHAVATDACFALVQIAIAFAIAWQPTVKLGLAVSVAWSVAVWWIGEGLGGVLNGSANPVSGAPGAVMIYALLAVLLWPSDRANGRAHFIAARAVGPSVAKGLWLVLWGSLSYFAVLGANRSSQGLRSLLTVEAVGEPGWVAWIDHHAATAVDHQGLLVSATLAVLLLVVGIGPYLPRAPANVAVVLAVIVSLVIWVVGEDIGALFTNVATDVNSGPLLVLLALAYWQPSSTAATSRAGAPATELQGAPT